MEVRTVKMPDGLLVDFDETWSDDDIREAISAKYPELDPINQGTEFTRGVKRGFETSKSLVTEGVPGIAKATANKATGLDIFDPTENMVRYQEDVSKAQRKYPTEFSSFKDISFEDGMLKGAGDVAGYIGGAAGELVPQMAAQLTGGAAVGMGVKMGVKQLAKRAGTQLTDEQVKKAMNKGILASTLTTSGAQTIPESYFNLLEQGEDAPLTAILTGGLKAGLDIIPEVGVLKKILGPNASDVVGDTLLKKIGVQTAKTAGAEGLTESAQEGLDIIAEEFILDNPDMFSKENITKLIDAGLKGAVGGGVMGGATAPLMQTEQDSQFDMSKLSPKDKNTIETRMQEEVVAVAPRYKDLPDTNESLLEDSVVEPIYTTPEVDKQLNLLGVRKESVANLSAREVEDSMLTLTSLGNATGPVTLRDLSKGENQEQSATLQDIQSKRLTNIGNQTRTDNEFIVGDGEIVTGAPISTGEVMQNPFARMEVVDSNKNVKQYIKATTRPEDLKLPSALKGAKPRYKTAEVDFNNDIEKAIYVAGSPNTSKKKQEYRNWLTDNIGLTPKQINAFRQGMLKSMNKNYKQGDTKIRPPELDVVRLATEAKFQKVQLPTTGNFFEDFVAPVAIAKNLKGMPLTEKGSKQYGTILNTVHRILNEVSGGKLNLKPFAALKEDPTNAPIAGYQLYNDIGIALNDTVTFDQGIETAYHEAWHAFERSGAFSKQEIEIIENQTKRLKEYISRNEFLSGQDFATLLETPAGREEIRANAAGLWMSDKYLGNEDGNKLLPPAFRRAFRKMSNYYQRLRNALQGLGFRSFDDIMNSVYTGSRTQDLLANMQQISQEARMQKLSTQTQKAHNDYTDTMEYAKSLEEDALKLTNDSSSIKKYGAWGRYTQSIAALASDPRYPMAAKVFEAVRSRLIKSNTLMERYASRLEKFSNLDRGIRHQLHELSDYLNNTGQKSRLDKDGYLMYERDGVIVRLKDKELSERYMEMQEAYASVLTDYEDSAREAAKKAIIEGKEDTPLTAEMELTDDVIQQMQPMLTGERNGQILENLTDTLTSIRKMKDKDFTPKMRFGKYGFAVKDIETNETVSFDTIEEGSFKSTFDTWQLEQLQKKYKEKYSDTSKYKIIGNPNKGAITDLNSIENLQPFVLTKNNITNEVDPRFINIELLSSLLYSKGLDEAEYNELKTEIFNDIVNKGFARRFSETKRMDGYSKDWDRVQHAYLSGAAHYFSGFEYSAKLPKLKEEVDSIIDPRLRDKLQSYMKYMDTPQEDYQMVRQINFLWTMGGNVSTALLQLMTLPTSTIGQMTRFNPNYLQNGKHINKWLGIFGKEFLNPAKNAANLRDGNLHFRMNDPAILKDLVDRGVIDKSAANLLRKTGEMGSIKAVESQEYTGGKPFETRSRGGGMREKLSNFSSLAGIPVSSMEQATRFATVMATHDMLTNNKTALDNAVRQLGKDPRFLAQLNAQQDLTMAENLALFSMDEAHAIFGKVGRVEYMRGAGGAIVVPFMTYPHYMLELLARFGRSGKDGRRAIMAMLGGMYAVGGLLGLPGMELLKELIEFVEKEVTGSEEDLDLLIREKIYGLTGSSTFAKFITQGLGRSALGSDLARRTGIPVPGQDILFSMLGIRKSDPTAFLGVQGSILTGAGEAWSQYNSGASIATAGAALLPVVPSNIVKSINMGSEGVSTRRGIQLVTPEDTTAQTRLLRAIGVTSDQIASKREEMYYGMLADMKYRTGIDRMRTKAKRIATKLARARADNDAKKVKELTEDYSEVLLDLQEFGRKEDIPIDFKAFNRSVMDAVKQRIDPRFRPEEARKASRGHVQDLSKVLGTEGK